MQLALCRIERISLSWSCQHVSLLWAESPSSGVLCACRVLCLKLHLCSKTIFFSTCISKSNIISLTSPCAGYEDSSTLFLTNSSILMQFLFLKLSPKSVDILGLLLLQDIKYKFIIIILQSSFLTEVFSIKINSRVLNPGGSFRG